MDPHGPKRCVREACGPLVLRFPTAKRRRHPMDSIPRAPRGRSSTAIRYRIRRLSLLFSPLSIVPRREEICQEVSNELEHLCPDQRQSALLDSERQALETLDRGRVYFSFVSSSIDCHTH